MTTDGVQRRTLVWGAGDSDSQEEANQLDHLAKHVMDGSGPLWLYLPRIYLVSNAFGVTAVLKKKIIVKQSIFSTNLAIRETLSNKC